ncbi:MAG TPA: Lrp/AsnC family transcriptional regulator [Paracoccaceae bacterium]|nr:Lrp/AsnC family transcriptional regulator [Paracoccaceae bacterium]
MSQPRSRRGPESVERFDEVDRRILEILQRTVDRPVTAIAEEVGLSPTPCWRRIKRFEETGLIRARVALVDPRRANVPMTVFIGVKAARHERQWLTDFRALIEDIPEITEAYRLTGTTDYILKVIVPDISAFDAVYTTMVDRLDFAEVNSSISMEEIKFTTAVPVSYL